MREKSIASQVGLLLLVACSPRDFLTAGLREYDDGWRIVQTNPRTAQTLEDAFKNAEPVP